MASIERSAKRTVKLAGKTVKEARRTATRTGTAARGVAKQVVGVIGTASQPRSRKGKVALAVGLTVAAVALKRARNKAIAKAVKG